MATTDWIVEIVKILVVPLIVAWAAATLGVRRGLEQAKRERAFDRSLEWHENAIRAMGHFSNIVWELANEWRSRTWDETLKRLQLLDERTIDVQRVLQESVLFADRKIVIELREDLFELDDFCLRVRAIREPNDISDIEGILESGWAFAKDFRKLAFSLSQQIRSKLDLEVIEEDDLKSETEKWMEETHWVKGTEKGQ